MSVPQGFLHFNFKSVTKHHCRWRYVRTDPDDVRVYEEIDDPESTTEISFDLFVFAASGSGILKKSDEEKQRSVARLEVAAEVPIQPPRIPRRSSRSPHMIQKVAKNTGLQEKMEA